MCASRSHPLTLTPVTSSDPHAALPGHQVNKTDAANLSSAMPSLAAIMRASKDALAVCSGARALPTCLALAARKRWPLSRVC